jgi:hypothetical protein
MEGGRLGALGCSAGRGVRGRIEKRSADVRRSLPFLIMTLGTVHATDRQYDLHHWRRFRDRSGDRSGARRGKLGNKVTSPDAARSARCCRCRQSGMKAALVATDCYQISARISRATPSVASSRMSSRGFVISAGPIRPQALERNKRLADDQYPSSSLWFEPAGRGGARRHRWQHD